jgi:hypothetical protein
MVTLKFVRKVEPRRRRCVDNLRTQQHIGVQGWRDEMRGRWRGRRVRIQVVLELKNLL